MAFPPPEQLARRSDETVKQWTARLSLNQLNEFKRWQSQHRWAPNQLRHSAATEVRKVYGLEAAQLVLGHASADVSQIYAERDMNKARENRHIAEQSHQVAEASKQLVEADAKARQEIIELQGQLIERDAQGRAELDQLVRETHAELRSDKRYLDQQRVELERQAVARARQRKPVIAESIQAFGLVLACLLPLLQRRYRSKSRDAGPVNFIGWFGRLSRVLGLSQSSPLSRIEAATIVRRSPLSTV